MLLKLDIRKASSVASTSPAVLGRVQASPRRGRARPARLSTVAALGFFKRKIATSGAVDDLLAAIEGSERGCRTSKSQRARIDAALGVLEEAGYDNVPINKSLSATWRLVWTTEKVIDTEALTLQNIITFPPDGAFVVQSTIDLLDNQRVQFEFTGASLILPRRELTLPPYGKGWFDIVYMDNKIRVSKDSRGDTLIVTRDGAPRDVIA